MGDYAKTFTLRKRFTFEAAHFLPDHDGKCRRLHGHSWVGWVEVAADVLQEDGPKRGMVVDYGDISAVVSSMVGSYLDHYCLNETLPVPVTTSEAVAEWIYHHLRSSGLSPSAVTIEETCTSSCTYRPVPGSGDGG
ncbi:MAG TPA: 6-carboxytetrahydropterin synthase QueD [Streptosporangiaceae bacterium]